MTENCLVIESEHQNEVVVDNIVASEGEQDGVDSDIHYAVLTAAIGGAILAHLASIERMKIVSDYPKTQGKNFLFSLFYTTNLFFAVFS